jgi:hypothetical protein
MYGRVRTFPVLPVEEGLVAGAGTSTAGGRPHVSGGGTSTVHRMSKALSSRKGVAVFFANLLRFRLARMLSSKKSIA